MSSSTVSFIAALSDTFQRERLAKLVTDFKVNGDLTQAKALHTIPAVCELFRQKTSAVRCENFLEHLVSRYPVPDMHSVRSAANAYAIFFLYNFHKKQALPPVLAMAPYCRAVFGKFRDTCSTFGKAEAKKLGLATIKTHLKNLGAPTCKSVTLAVMRELAFAFYPMSGEDALELRRSGAAMVLCLSLGRLRTEYKKENLRKLADGVVARFKEGMASGTVERKRSAAARVLATAFATINCRLEWRKETLAFLGSLQVVRVSPVQHSSARFSGSDPSPREVFYAEKFAMLARAKGFKMKKTHYEWHAIRRVQKRMPAALKRVPAAVTHPCAPRVKEKCPDRSCRGPIVVESGYRVCRGCGTVLGRGVHGKPKDVVDKDTGKSYCHHAPVLPYVQNTYIDTEHRGARGLLCAIRRSLALRDPDDCPEQGVKLGTIARQKMHACDIFTSLTESTDLPTAFVNRASRYFNAYRAGPGANAMNFYEVGIASTLLALPPANPPCVGTCSTVALIGGVALSSPESCKIADLLGRQRGGLKMATLEGGCSVSFMGREHVFAGVGGHTIAVPRDDRVLRLRGLAELPPTAMLRIYASGGSRTSRSDITARGGSYFRGTLDMDSPCEQLHVEVYTQRQERRRCALPKTKKTILFHSALPLVGPWKLSFPGGCLAMQTWSPRLTLVKGCGARFTTLYDMKSHNCSACKRKRVDDMTGRRKMRRL